MVLLTKMDFVTRAQRKAGTRLFSEFVNESRKYSRNLYTTSVFLSHAHTEKSFIQSATVILRNLGVDVYVDWTDESMPEKTNGVTAQKIKQQIIANDKFILLATKTAIASKWCNWELGYGDAAKSQSKKIAILPLADSDGTWTGNEYLQIYPRIEPTGRLDEYAVFYPDGSSIILPAWLKK